MFINLTLSIICAAMMFISFKLFARFGINLFQGIVFNYWTAAGLSFTFCFGTGVNYMNEIKQIMPAPLLIGSMFILVFYFTALTTQIFGLAVATIAAKMSVVIPVASGIFLFDDYLGIAQIAGIVIALTAVYFVASGKPASEKKSSNKMILLLPAALFIGTGLVDAAIKYAQHTFMQTQSRYLVMMCLFGTAGSIGIIILLVQVLRKIQRISFRNLAGGIVLGIFNYFSLYFLVTCLEMPGAKSSVVFTLLNTGIILLTAFAALFIFSEKLSVKKYMGIALSVIAILLLAF